MILRRREVRGITTVEMAYIMPVIMLVFLAVIYATFYYHDKNVLIGMAYETAVIGAQQERTPKGMQEGELSAFFMERTRSKLILFGGAQMAVSQNDQYVIVQASASKKRMKLDVEMKAPILDPEKYIRLIRKVK